MEKAVNITINHLQHIGIPVTNIQRSQLFYEKLGFNNVMRAGFDHEDGKGTCIMMERRTIIIELYEFPAPALAPIRQRKDGHIDHIAFDVPDIDEAFTTLKEAGFEVIEEAPVFLAFWTRGCKYFNIIGPDGERLEFNQRM